MNRFFNPEEFVFESQSDGHVGIKSKIIKAIRKSDGLDVVLKFSSLDDMEISKYIRNFGKVASIRHPNIIQHFAIFTLDESFRPYHVVELIEYANAGPLSNSLIQCDQNGELVSVIRQSLMGLHILHLNGVLHRDIKATNILLSRKNKMVTAKISDIEFRESVDGKLYTTPEFLAPEATNSSSYTVKSEVWAVGVMLYEIFSGSYPFGSRLEGLSIEKIRETTKTLSTPELTKIPEPFKQMVERSLIKDVWERKSTMKELSDLLSPFSVLKATIRSIMQS